MIRSLRLGALALILGSRAVSVVHAEGSATGTFSNTPNNSFNFVGYHINGPLNDPYTPLYPHGLSLDVDGLPWWSFGIDKSTKDFFLYSQATSNYQFRMRGDTGQIAIGPQATQPVIGTRQLDVVGGKEDAAIAAIRAKVFGSQNGLSLTQGLTTTSRVQINFNNLWQLGIDSTADKTQIPPQAVDFYLSNIITNRKPLTISAADVVSLGVGLAHSGSLGFFGTTPVTQKPVITGCRSDGTALLNLLTALKNMGLIDDQTTP